jgi:DNA polymerase I-like protein with 3'-5' exonuclease and polymerase domains
MLINVDVKGLEVSCAAFLSKDKVLVQELMDGVDMHGVNQENFGLPTRLIAKTLVFRILYGGTEYSFAQDPEFTPVSKRTSYWKDVIEKFYTKYNGLYKWHTKLVDNVVLTGMYTSPIGREYSFKPYTNNRGELQWPRTNILNYPVQGLGNDIVSIMRVSLWNRIKRMELGLVKMIATVHDSILLDVPNHLIDQVVNIVEGVAKDVPGNFFKVFGVQYTLPFLVEVEIGKDYSNMENYK